MADKVLVVDDDKAILTMLHKALKSNGIENDLAISGEAALELLETNSYDLILLDINMRGINQIQRPDHTGHGSKRTQGGSGRALRTRDRSGRLHNQAVQPGNACGEGQGSHQKEP